MANDDLGKSKTTRYTITGAGCKVIIEGCNVISGKGPTKEFKKLLYHWMPMESETFPFNVVYALRKANNEIKKISKIAALSNSDKEKVARALKYLEENKSKNMCIKPKYISDTWFDISHGLRNARYATLHLVAAENGMIIKPKYAIEVLLASLKNRPIPEVPFILT